MGLEQGPHFARVAGETANWRASKNVVVSREGRVVIDTVSAVRWRAAGGHEAGAHGSAPGPPPGDVSLPPPGLVGLPPPGLVGLPVGPPVGLLVGDVVGGGVTERVIAGLTGLGS